MLEKLNRYLLITQKKTCKESHAFCEYIVDRFNEITKVSPFDYMFFLKFKTLIYFLLNDNIELKNKQKQTKYYSVLLKES
tara:strand:+ start:343 stop:582 length:240 start_codon:yes stop_codon:yes gene_type:complete